MNTDNQCCLDSILTCDYKVVLHPDCPISIDVLKHILKQCVYRRFVSKDGTIPQGYSVVVKDNNEFNIVPNNLMLVKT